MNVRLVVCLYCDLKWLGWVDGKGDARCENREKGKEKNSI